MSRIEARTQSRM